MDYLRTLVAACFLVSGSAHAAYAQLSPPPGWSGGSTGGQFAYGQAANSATIANGTVRTTATLNVAGRSVSIPASMRFAANAPRIAAAAIFLNPGLRTAVGIASWLGVGKVVWDAANNKWISQNPGPNDQVSDGKEYSFPGYPWSSSIESACLSQVPADSPYNYVITEIIPQGCRVEYFRKTDGVIAGAGGFFGVQSRPSSCPAGWYITAAGCSQNPQPKQLTQQEMVELLNPENTPGWPISDSFLGEFPRDLSLPVELPVVNPSTGVNPFPKPLFIPTGDPVRNPNYDPNAAPGPNNQPFIQPGTNVTPRPTPSNPWQVDVQPVSRPQPGADPLPDAEQNPETDPNDKPKEEDQKSLCEKHPDIVACQKLGDINPENLAKNTVTLQINREEGFGPANGACPAPKQFVVMGKSMAFQWDLLCDFASQIRPLLVGFAYLSAALSFFGLSRKD